MTDQYLSIILYTTLIDLLPKLLKQKIIIETRKIGKSTLYKLNTDNPIVKAMLAIDIKLSEAGIPPSMFGANKKLKSFTHKEREEMWNEHKL